MPENCYLTQKGVMSHEQLLGLPRQEAPIMPAVMDRAKTCAQLPTSDLHEANYLLLVHFDLRVI